MRGALVAGDVITTATAGAEGAARNGETADSAQLNGHDRTAADQVTATGPQAGAPSNHQVQPSPGEASRTSRGVPDGSAPQGTPSGASAADPRPRPARQTRQGLAPAAQPASPRAGGRR